MDSTTSRRMHRVIEPVHAMIYFAPEAQAEYEGLGLSGPAELYFPSRAAALGVVPWQVVQATFFGFSPLAVQFGIAEAWTKTTPQDVLAARFRGVDGALRRIAPDLVGDVAEALDLVRIACDRCEPPGRPLYAAHAALPEPAEPHLALWHGLSLLREYRGDGHIAALVSAEVTAPQALVLNGSWQGGAVTQFLQQTRAWTQDEWNTAAKQLEERGWVDGEGALTAAGRTAREGIEELTDELALPPYEHLGLERTERLYELLLPLSKTVVASGTIPIKPPK
jgi:hypothetical protein